MAMDKEKFSVKEEIKNELRESVPYNITPQDLEIDDAIVDKYTSSVFAKFKKGETNNRWFTASGILSILFGVIAFLTIIIIAIVFAVKRELIVGDGNFESVRTKIIISCIVVPIIAIISIIVGAKIKSYSKYSKARLIDNVVSISVMIVLQFLFGGLIFSALTIVGYFVGIGSDYGAIYYNKVDNPSTQVRRLADAKKLFQDGVIDEQEFKNLKEHILRESDFE